MWSVANVFNITRISGVSSIEFQGFPQIDRKPVDNPPQVWGPSYDPHAFLYMQMHIYSF
jgi:hypothetical protein